MEGVKIVSTQKEAAALNPEYIFKDSDTIYRCYMPGERVIAVVVEAEKSAIVREIESSPLSNALVEEIAALKNVSKEVLIASMEAKAVTVTSTEVVGKSA